MNRKRSMSRKAAWQAGRQYIPGSPAETGNHVRENILRNDGLTDVMTAEPVVRRGSASRRHLGLPDVSALAEFQEDLLREEGLSNAQTVNRTEQGELEREDDEDDDEDDDELDEDEDFGDDGEEGADDLPDTDDDLLEDEDEDEDEDDEDEDEGEGGADEDRDVLGGLADIILGKKASEHKDWKRKQEREEGKQKSKKAAKEAAEAGVTVDSKPKEEKKEEKAEEKADKKAEKAEKKEEAKVGRLPIFEPQHNVREIAKQLWLLEDHLSHPEKFCPDCIRKHLLGAEALAEEAITLDKDGSHHEVLTGLPERIRNLGRSFLANDDRRALAQQVRVLRKELSKAGFGSIGLFNPEVREAKRDEKIAKSEAAAAKARLKTARLQHRESKIDDGENDEGEELGFLPLLMALGKGVRSGVTFAKSEKGRAFMKKVGKKKAQAAAVGLDARADLLGRLEEAVKEGRVTVPIAARYGRLLDGEPSLGVLPLFGIAAGVEFAKSSGGKRFLGTVTKKKEKAETMGLAAHAALLGKIANATAAGQVTEQAAVRYAAVIDEPFERRGRDLDETVRRTRVGWARQRAFSGVSGVGADLESGRVVAYVRPGFEVGLLPDTINGFPVVAVDTVTGAVSAPPPREAFGAFDYAATATPLSPVIYATPSAGRLVWKEGVKAAPGQQAVLPEGTVQVTSNPVGGQYIVQDRDTGAFAKVPAGLVVRRPRNPISDLLRGRTLYRYSSDGPPLRFGAFTADQLRMADLVQSVFEARLPEACGAIRAGLTQDTRLTTEEKDNLCKSVIPDKVLKGAIINAIYESKLDPNIIGDSGNSVGLFQLNIRGAGVGMSVAERQDPIRNTERILEEFARRFATAGIYQNLLGRELASALSKNPALSPGVDAWTDAWTKEVERPADPNAGTHRGRTAREAFPTEGQKSLYERYVAPVVAPVVAPIASRLPEPIYDLATAPSSRSVFTPPPVAPVVEEADHTVRNVALGLGGLFFGGALLLGVSKLASGGLS